MSQTEGMDDDMDDNYRDELGEEVLTHVDAIADLCMKNADIKDDDDAANFIISVFTVLIADISVARNADALDFVDKVLKLLPLEDLFDED